MPRDRIEPSTATDRFWLASGAVLAAVATAGSLWFSLGLGLVPCTLCWYQRILMYPHVVVLGVATVENHSTIWRTVVPLSVLGGIIAVYHSILQVTTTSCTFAGPCAVVQWRAPMLGLTIPNLSLIAFVLVTMTVLAGSDVVDSQRQP